VLEKAPASVGERWSLPPPEPKVPRSNRGHCDRVRRAGRDPLYIHAAVSWRLESPGLVVTVTRSPETSGCIARRFDVQGCVQEWKRKGCESRLRPSHPCANNSSTFQLLSETVLFSGVLQSQACCQLHQGAELTSAQQVSLEVAKKRDVCNNELQCAPLSFTAAYERPQR
jgi:hypothetical protein